MRQGGISSIHVAKISTKRLTLKYTSCNPPRYRPLLLWTRVRQVYNFTNAQVTNINPAAPAIAVGTATGQVQRSTATGQLSLPNIPNNFPSTGHIMPGFNHTLLGVGPICDADCMVTFSRDAVVVRDVTNRAILTVWREEQSPYLWRIALLPDNADIPKVPQDSLRVSLVA